MALSCDILRCLLSTNQNIYILLGAFFEIQADIFYESNTERRVKISAGISKEGT